VQAVKNIVGKAASGDLRSAASHVWQAAAEGGPRMLSPQMDFLLRLASTGTYAATMILLTLQARPERWAGAARGSQRRARCRPLTLYLTLTLSWPGRGSTARARASWRTRCTRASTWAWPRPPPPCWASSGSSAAC